MPKHMRTPRSLPEQIGALDDHLYLLRQQCRAARDDLSHLKAVAAELRLLVCVSGRKAYAAEGLLFRVAERLGVSDAVHVHAATWVKKDHPLAKGMSFGFVPVQWAGRGDPRLPPALYSLKWLLRNCQAAYLRGKELTHDWLIRAVAEEIGSAHEDEGIEPDLEDVRSVVLAGQPLLATSLLMLGELVLHVGARTLSEAEAKLQRRCKVRPPGSGDVTLVVRLALRQHVAGPVPVAAFHSYVSAVTIACSAAPGALVWTLRRDQDALGEARVPYPFGSELGKEAVFSLAYSSGTREAVVGVGGSRVARTTVRDLVWLDGWSLILERPEEVSREFVSAHYALVYERLLGPHDWDEFAKLPPDLHGLWLYPHEVESGKPPP